MNQTFKRVLQVGLATAVVSVMNVGLGASNASATENTWIRNLVSGECIHALDGGELAPAQECRFGELRQLWDRRGPNIVRAYSNQCLDSNRNGHVYWMECNGGDYQKWEFRSDKRVRNVATGMFLAQQPGSDWVITNSSVNTNQSTWEFYGGE